MNGKGYLKNVIKQKLFQYIRPQARLLVQSFPMVRQMIQNNALLVEAFVTFAAPAIATKLEELGERSDLGDVKKALFELSSDIFPEVVAEIQQAASEPGAAASGAPVSAAAATPVTVYLPPKLWAHMDRPKIVYHPACKAQHHRVLRPKKGKDGKPIEGELVESIASGFHDFEFEAAIRGSARAPEAEEEGYREGCSCAELIHDELARLVAAKAQREAAQAAKSAPATPAKPATPPQPESLGTMVGRLYERDKARAVLFLRVYALISNVAKKRLEYCDDVREFEMLLACLNDEDSDEGLKRMAALLEEAAANMLKSRVDRYKGILGLGGDLVQGLVEIDHALAQDDRKGTRESSRIALLEQIARRNDVDLKCVLEWLAEKDAHLPENQRRNAFAVGDLSPKDIHEYLEDPDRPLPPGPRPEIPEPNWYYSLRIMLGMSVAEYRRRMAEKQNQPQKKGWFRR